MAQRNPSSLADNAVVAPLFKQPQKRGDPGAGFYAPDFWQQNLDLSTRVTCLSGGRPPAGSGLRSRPPTLSPRSLGPGAGIYTNIAATDIWPTPPG